MNAEHQISISAIAMGLLFLFQQNFILLVFNLLFDSYHKGLARRSGIKFVSEQNSIEVNDYIVVTQFYRSAANHCLARNW